MLIKEKSIYVYLSIIFSITFIFINMSVQDIVWKMNMSCKKKLLKYVIVSHSVPKYLIIRADLLIE